GDSRWRRRWIRASPLRPQDGKNPRRNDRRAPRRRDDRRIDAGDHERIEDGRVGGRHPSVPDTGRGAAKDRRRLQPRPTHARIAKNLPEVVRVAQKIGLIQVELGATALRSAKYVVKGVVRAAMSDVLKQ